MTPIAHTVVASRWVRLALVAVALSAALIATGCKTSPPGGGGGASSTTSGEASGTGGAATVPAKTPPAASPPPAQPADSQPSSGTAAGAAASLPSATSSGGESGSAAGPGSGHAQTSEERRASIDKRFDDSLGSFDRELRKEQEKNAQERDTRTAADIDTVPGSADTESGTTDSDKKDDEEDTGGSAGTEGPRNKGDDKSDRTRRPGDLKSDKDSKSADGKSAGNTPASGSGAGATEIPDGSDDDVVARRLRKAAERETDPELKEKLWKEYIEYKKNTR